MKNNTVDCKFNLKFIKRKFANGEILLNQNGSHHLMNESRPVNFEVISIVVDYLEGIT